jgi:hypothetical protein
MSYRPSEEWYDEIFNNCKTRGDVELKARVMIRSRDKEICEHEEKVLTIAQGHAATIESLINQMY